MSAVDVGSSLYTFLLPVVTAEDVFRSSFASGINNVSSEL